MHIKEDILDETGHIDQHKIDQVARMGGNCDSRANLGLFEVPKPLSTLGIGVDSIPKEIKESHVLTGNDFGKLGNVEALPTATDIAEFLKADPEAAELVKSQDLDKIHSQAQKFLKEDRAGEAWKILLAK